MKRTVNRYIKGHQPRSFEKALEAIKAKNVDKMWFRTIVLRIKYEQMWTWRDIGEITGMRPSNISSRVHSMNEAVSQEWAGRVLGMLFTAADPHASMPYKEIPCTGKTDELFMPPGIRGMHAVAFYEYTIERFCARCPRAEACLEENVTALDGVFGGTTPLQREEMRREQRKKAS
jgi:hypothetical protein